MPATAQVRGSRVSQEVGRASIPKESWSEFIAVLDPLAEWNMRFLEWRTSIEEFRMMEQNRFFLHREDPLLRRVHRGWLCDLISTGERLGIELLQFDRPTDTRDSLQFLDLFLENLQATLETWHLTEVPEAAQG